MVCAPNLFHSTLKRDKQLLREIIDSIDVNSLKRNSEGLIDSKAFTAMLYKKLNERFKLNWKTSDTVSYEEFETSIQALISTLHKSSELSKKFTSDKKFNLKQAINSLYDYISTKDDIIPIINTDPDKTILNEDLKNETNRKKYSLKRLREMVYFGLSALETRLASNFSSQAKRIALIDFKKKTLVANLDELNENIEEFLKDLYTIIYNWLKNNGYNFTAPNGLFANHKRNFNTYKTLNIFFNVITHDANLQDKLTEGWENEMIGDGKSLNIDLINAIEAYMNLVYFDELFLDELDGFVSIGSLQGDIIITEGNIVRLKYTFGKVENSLDQDWTADSNKDAVKLLGKLSKLVTGDIPRYSVVYNNGRLLASALASKLAPVDVMSAKVNLKNAVRSIANNPQVKRLGTLLTEHLANPSNFKDILELLFLNRQQSLVDRLVGTGKISMIDIGTLYSLYEYMYKGQDSVLAIELKFILENGALPAISIIDTLIGIGHSTVGMNYLQTEYNIETGQWETSTKSPYNVKGFMFEFIHQVNGKLARRSDFNELVDKYRIFVGTTGFTATISFAVNGILFRISGENALFKTDLVSPNIEYYDNGRWNKLELNTLKDLLDSIDKRKRFLNKTTDDVKDGTITDERLLKAVLTVTDAMLGTSFNNSLSSMLELYLTATAHRTFLPQLFTTVGRTLGISYLYKKMLDNPKYTKGEIMKFLKNEGQSLYTAMDFKQASILTATDSGVPFLRVLDGKSDFLKGWAYMKGVISGAIVKSTTVDLEGNKIPNYSPAFLADQIDSYITESKESANIEAPTSALLFSLGTNNTTIREVQIDDEVRNAENETKKVKGMNKTELYYHSIVDKIFIPLQSAQPYVLILASTMADKGKFPNYQIIPNDKTDEIGQLLTHSITDDNFFANIYLQTVGNFYKKLANGLIKDYARLSPEVQALLNEYAPSGYIMGSLSRDLYVQLFTAILNYLNTISDVNQLYELGQSLGINVSPHFHFRQLGKRLVLNELIVNNTINLYNSTDSVAQRFSEELLRFVNDLLNSGITFEVKLSPQGTLITDNVKEQNAIGNLLIKEVGATAARSWVLYDKLIIAKVTGADGKVRDILYGRNLQLKEGETLQVNPALKRAFYILSILLNNLRLYLTGSEVNHELKKLDRRTAQVQKRLNSTASLGELLLTTNDPIVLEAVLKTEAEALVIQVKRNVIISGTMHYYLTNSLFGIGSKLRMAMVNSLRAPVYNPDGSGTKYSKGLGDRMKALDGMALLSPITSILENNSLLDNAVGTTKKPIWHHYDMRHGVAGLGKFAVDTMTNWWMRNAESPFRDSKIVLYDLFKKMHNELWFAPGEEHTWNLFTSEHTEDRQVSWGYIVTLLPNLRAFYERMLGTHAEIVDFQLVNINGLDVYITKENTVNKFGKKVTGTNTETFYHLFDADSNHYMYTADQLQANPSLMEGKHTINSVYELHRVMGGLDSESLGANGTLEKSEASNELVAVFANMVTLLRDKTNTNPRLSQLDYYQPLKEHIISYVSDNTAIKNGAGNINDLDVFFDPSKALKYVVWDTKSYGILQDSDHEAIESEMTEFSLVISALDAGGRLHPYVQLIYTTLGQLALQEAKIELDALTEFKRSDDFNVLYDVIGRSIINNLSKQRGLAGLADAIISSIAKTFNTTTDHAKDKFAIPFSDPNIYSSIISIAGSTLTRRAIKKKYPGIGDVLMGSYKISLVFELNGDVMQYEDIIRRINEDPEFIQQYFVSNPLDKLFETDQLVLKRNLVLAWLRNELLKLRDSGEYKWIWRREGFDVSDFEPAEQIEVQYVADVEGLKSAFISLEAIEDYYAFLDSPIAFLHSKLQSLFGITGANIIQFARDITHSRDLAPMRVSWEYGNSQHMNYYAHPVVRAIYNPSDKTPIELKRKRLLKLNNLLLLNAMLPLDVLTDRVKLSILDSDEEYVSLQVPVVNLENKPAEIIGGNIYAKRFGLDINASLDEVAKRGPLAFKISPILHTQRYDLVFTTRSGEHAYVTMQDMPSINEDYDYRELEWKSYREKKWASPERDMEGYTIIANIYATNKDGNDLFIIGRSRIRHDLVYEESTGKYILQLNNTDGKYSVDEQGNVLETFTKPERIVTRKDLTVQDGKIIGVTNEDGNFLILEDGTVLEVLPERTFTRLRRDVYQSDTGTFYLKLNPKNFYVNSDGQVVELVFFVKKYNIEESTKSGTTMAYTLYRFDTQKAGAVRIKRLSDISRLILNLQAVPVSDSEGYTYDEAEGVYMLHGQKLLQAPADFVTYNGTVYRVTTSNVPKVGDVSIAGKFLALLYQVSDFLGMRVNANAGHDKAELLYAIKAFGSEVGTGANNTEIKEFADAALEFMQGKLKPVEYNKRLKEIYDKVANRAYVSFFKSLDCTAARIPSQTLLSFMKMRYAGFTGTSDNYCFVSHWQLWLLGSDLDIDKTYIMGHAFDNGGSYVGWSDLFDFTSIETLRASERLPYPKLRNLTRGGTLVAGEMAAMLQAKESLALSRLNAYKAEPTAVNKANYILAIADLLDFITAYDIHELGNINEEVFADLQVHEYTHQSDTKNVLALRNYISSHILHVIESPTNLIEAMSPILISMLSDAMELSPKLGDSDYITMANPLSVYTILYEALVGRNVIGIGANGMKGSFMWTTALNELLNTPINPALILAAQNPEAASDELVLEAESLNARFDRARFSFVSNRILNRAKKFLEDAKPETERTPVEIIPVEVNTLPGIREDLPLASLLGLKLNPLITTSLLNSLVVSAATDNMKELILAKINAGSKLAKCYLYLITLGFNIDDIVVFMTSDTVDFIDNITNESIYTKNAVSEDLALKLAAGEVTSGYLYGHTSKNLARFLASKENLKVLSDYLKTPDMTFPEFAPKDGTIINHDDLENLKIQLSSIKEMRTVRNINLEDVEELNNILKAATEFTNFTLLLGINQGLPTSKADLDKMLMKIKSIVTNAEESSKPKGSITNLGIAAGVSLEIRGGKFDPIKWARNDEVSVTYKQGNGETVTELFKYRDLTAAFYDQFKISCNIFDLINYLPHFLASFTLLGYLSTLDHISIKSRTYDSLIETLKLNDLKLFVDDRIRNLLLRYIDSLLVRKFLGENALYIKLPSGTMTINSQGNEVFESSERTLLIDSDLGVALFKHFFENYFIPRLQQGEYWNGSAWVLLESNDFKQNMFINDLVIAFELDTSYYKPRMNVLARNDTNENLITYNKYVKGLSALKKYKVGDNLSLLDMFFLYNLIVHKNAYGRDKFTTLFLSLLSEKEAPSLLTKYISFVGEQDKLYDAILPFNVTDALVFSARRVSSERGKYFPSIVIATPEGLEYKIKSGYSYLSVPVYPKGSLNETPTLKLLRKVNFLNYFVLRGTLATKALDLASILQNTKQDNWNTIIEQMNNLIKEGLLIIDMNCE